mmetsp:Transcript_30035/g.97790  ORF Transcript_30035/g.97790 Transcript_30035/m.97790 type:complete len:419 (-) Transcript_30035:260-1516(-)
MLNGRSGREGSGGGGSERGGVLVADLEEGRELFVEEPGVGGDDVHRGALGPRAHLGVDELRLGALPRGVNIRADGREVELLELFRARPREAVCDASERFGEVDEREHVPARSVVLLLDVAEARCEKDPARVVGREALEDPATPLAPEVVLILPDEVELAEERHPSTERHSRHPAREHRRAALALIRNKPEPFRFVPGDVEAVQLVPRAQERHATREPLVDGFGVEASDTELVRGGRVVHRRLRDLVHRWVGHGLRVVKSHDVLVQHHLHALGHWAPYPLSATKLHHRQPDNHLHEFEAHHCVIGVCRVYVAGVLVQVILLLVRRIRILQHWVKLKVCRIEEASHALGRDVLARLVHDASVPHKSHVIVFAHLKHGWGAGIGELSLLRRVDVVGANVKLKEPADLLHVGLEELVDSVRL